MDELADTLLRFLFDGKTHIHYYTDEEETDVDEMLLTAKEGLVSF